MNTGTYISGVGHVALIGWAILGSAFSSNPEPQEFQVTDISVVSEAAFAALVSDAPDTAAEVNPLDSPTNSEIAPDAPKPDDAPRLVPLTPRNAPPKADDGPDLAAVNAPPRAQALIDAPEIAALPTTNEVGATLILPTARIANRDSGGLRQPDKLVMVAPEAPSPRVDMTPAPKPPTDAEKAPEVEKATTRDDTATAQAEDKVEKAPDQAATEIITEAKEQAKTGAPLRSSRPKGRPARLAEKTRGPSEIDNLVAKAQAEDAATSTSTRTGVVAGPPLTKSEREGLRLAVQECWNVNSASDASRITVTVGLVMEKDGMPLISSIRRISASDGSKSAQGSAFEAARRAIIRCSKGGYDLPVEKYDRWRDIEITFNPEKMRRK
ncbi:MAG: hypothetical protein GXP03_12285 [Alphaproteobacteria bacterium]|nr:hypothetical protein [Alphaproteobacteria bacterium]